MSWDLDEGTGQGDYPPFFTPADVADAERVRGARGAARRDRRPRRPVEPSRRRPRSTRSRSPAGCAAEGARPAVIRLHDLGALSMGGGSIERQSMLGRAADDRRPPARRRSTATTAGRALRLRDGQRRAPARAWPRSSATACGYGAPVAALARRRAACRVTLAGGEELRAEAVVCALPVGPLRDVAVSRRLRRAAREPAPPAPGARRQGRRRLPRARSGARRAPTASPTRESIVGSTWPQGDDALSMLVGARAARALPRRAARRPPRRGARRRSSGSTATRRGEPRRAARAPLGRRPVHPGLRHASGRRAT